MKPRAAYSSSTVSQVTRYHLSPDQVRSMVVIQDSQRDDISDACLHQRYKSAANLLDAVPNSNVQLTAATQRSSMNTHPQVAAQQYLHSFGMPTAVYMMLCNCYCCTGSSNLKSRATRDTTLNPSLTIVVHLQLLHSSRCMPGALTAGFLVSHKMLSSMLQQHAQPLASLTITTTTCPCNSNLTFFKPPATVAPALSTCRRMLCQPISTACMPYDLEHEQSCCWCHTQ